VSVDTELETWRQDWLSESDPLPELKRKIHRQNLWMIAAVVALVVCVAVSAVWASRTHSSFAAGLLAGLLFSSLCVGAYSWWVRRGAWKPAVQTTLAYAELTYKRAIAKVQTLRFSFWFLLAAIVAFGVILACDWKHFHAPFAAILAAMVVELFWIRSKERRKRAEVDEAAKLIENLKE
jgi:TRAP-type C4-dicarboxylate transport system permease large subunit